MVQVLPNDEHSAKVGNPEDNGDHESQKGNHIHGQTYSDLGETQ